MRKIMKYEAPEIKITRFEMEKSIMAPGYGDGNGDGDGNLITNPIENVSTGDIGDLELPEY